MNRISFISCAGTAEKVAGCINQDRCLSYAAGDTIAIGISDGAGSKKWSHIGAEKVTMSVLQYMVAYFDELYETEIQNVRYQIAREIVFEMEKLSKEYEVPEKELGATICIFVKKKGKYLSVQLGDSVIGKVNVEDRIEISKEKGRGRNERYSYLTSSNTFQKHLIIERNECREIKTVFLMTDGMSGELCEGRSGKVKEKYIKDLQKNNIGNIESRIKGNEILDDYSLISLQIQ